MAMQEKRQEQEAAVEDDAFGPMLLAKIEVAVLSLSVCLSVSVFLTLCLSLSPSLSLSLSQFQFFLCIKQCIHYSVSVTANNNVWCILIMYGVY